MNRRARAAMRLGWMVPAALALYLVWVLAITVAALAAWPLAPGGWRWWRWSLTYPWST